MNIPPRIGKYEVREVLGKGASGVVLRGFDAGIKRDVALKVVEKSNLDYEEREYALRRFRTEAQAVGRLTHPRIAAIFDYIETEELACIVMELVNGKSLQMHLKEERQFGFKDAWEIVRQILDGVGYTHSQGVTHRDLKPANILINDDGRIKITDFGVARIDSSTLTQVGDIVGTPHYMSPEQFAGCECTASTDLYQIGVMTYELLTGRRPFTGNNVEILRGVLNDRPAKPSSHNAKVTWQLDWAILKSLEKDPKDRFESAREFGEALKKGIDESLGTVSEAPVRSGAKGASLLDKARLIAGARDAGVLGGSDAAATDAAVSSFKALGDSRKARVLFVDDEQRILTALRSVFRHQYHVFTAENGALALEFVKRFGIHVVVSDQRMPNMLGVDLLRQVKELSPNAVRMLLTGYSDLAAIVGSINDGEVFRFVKKPWDNAELQKTIADAVAIAMELASLPPPPADMPLKFDAGVLVIDPANEFADGLAQLLQGTASVKRVANADAALKALESDEIGVIVADLAAGKDSLVTMFKLLKAQHPEILSILVTEAPDAELAIELINQAQVFRLMDKPLNTRMVRASVHMALARYASFKTAPVLVRQHRVSENAMARASDWGTRFFDRIRALPQRLFSRSA